MIEGAGTRRCCLLVAASIALAVVAPPVSGAHDAAAPPALPQVEGWTISTEVMTFGPESLYEHINGASELYLSYGFERLAVADYSAGPDVVTVEIYDHGAPARAFGIYSQERPMQGDFVAVGAEGYIEPPILNFVAGGAYVKLSAFEATAATADRLLSLGRGLAQALAAPARLPEALALFPPEGKVPHSERYAHRDFLGYSALREAFTADYEVDGARFQLFIIETASTAAADEMLRTYAKAASRCDPPEVAGDVPVVVADKYNGAVALVRHGARIGGVVRLEDAGLRDRWCLALSCRLSGAPCLGP